MTGQPPVNAVREDAARQLRAAAALTDDEDRRLRLLAAAEEYDGKSLLGSGDQRETV